MTDLNFKPNTLWAGVDNLPVMRGINSACVDLIYLDPPFNSNANYAAPIGSAAAGAEFKDTWTLNDIKVEWLNLLEQKHQDLSRFIQAISDNSMKSYLCYMAVRLLEMKRLLKLTGSIYLHCDPTASHYLKIIMDYIFGSKNFRNEIVWCYPPNGRPPKLNFPRKHDVILFYGKSNKVYFKQPFVELNEYQKGKFSKIDSDGRKYKEYLKGNRAYLDENKGNPIPCWWVDIGIATQSRIEHCGYPTQKPLKLLQRIIEASSSEGDLILDPFCGCVTTPIAAHQLHRNYIGIDISPKAEELMKLRFEKELRMFWNGIIRSDIPKRTDHGKLPKPRYHLIKLYGEQKGFCAGCQTHFEARNLHVDHIIDKANGGTDHIENLQLLCGSCNSIKGHRGMEYLKAKLNLLD